MDELDAQLIDALRADGRASYSDLAHRLKVSRSSISARIAELTSSQQIRVVAAVHPRLLGLGTLAHLAVRVSGTTQAVVESLAAIDGVAFLSETTGPYHVAAEVRVPTILDLELILAQVRSIAGVLDVAILLYERVVRSMFLGEEPRTSDLVIDDTDIAIMSELQEDGRVGFAELATRVGLSTSAARTRVIRLLNAHVMQIGAIRRRADDVPSLLFGVGMVASGESDALVEHLLHIDGLEFAAKTVGRYSVVATFEAPTISGLAEIVSDLRAHSTVRLLDTWIHQTVHLERYHRPLGQIQTSR